MWTSRRGGLGSIPDQRIWNFWWPGGTRADFLFLSSNSVFPCQCQSANPVFLFFIRLPSRLEYILQVENVVKDETRVFMEKYNNA